MTSVGFAQALGNSKLTLASPATIIAYQTRGSSIEDYQIGILRCHNILSAGIGLGVPHTKFPPLAERDGRFSLSSRSNIAILASKSRNLLTMRMFKACGGIEIWSDLSTSSKPIKDTTRTLTLQCPQRHIASTLRFA